MGVVDEYPFKGVLPPEILQLKVGAVVEQLEVPSDIEIQPLDSSEPGVLQFLSTVDLQLELEDV